MSTLLEILAEEPGTKIDVATAHPGLRDDSFEEHGIRYFVVGQPKLQSIFGCRKRDIEVCADIVRNCNPDLVHIHGTERFFGLLSARHLTSSPCVISLQGFLGACLPVFFGALSPGDVWRSTRLIEVATRRGVLWQYRKYSAGASQEREILTRARHFMGRTQWDLAYLRSLNPNAHYYQVGELLRPGFRHASWNLAECDPNVIFSTNAGGEPRRGTEVLLQALAIVRNIYPNAKLRLAGEIGTRRGYDRFLRETISRWGLSNAVECLGYLGEKDLVMHLCRSHVFATSSFIENSPNSLCEAMQVGLPCIASYAGGVPSLIEHDQTGLLFPVGDSALLADAILRIFRQESLTRRLGRAAKAHASKRHAPRTVVSQLLMAYRDVIANANGECYSATAFRA